MTNNEKSAKTAFHELQLVHPSGPAGVRNAVLKHLGGRWVHMLEREEEFRKQVTKKADVIVVERTQSETDLGVALWLFEQDDGSYKVSNIVPLTIGDLGVKGYNEALKDFVMTIAYAAVVDSGLQLEMSSGVESIKNWLDPASSSALQFFSDCANKSSSGRSHPLDEARWLAFVISAHRNQSPANGEALYRWLVDVGLWPSKAAEDLASDYINGLALLAKYDETL